MHPGSQACLWQISFLKAENLTFSPCTHLKDWEKHFLDASASKPSDWNSELDGDWQAAMLQKPLYQVRGWHRLPASPSLPCPLGPLLMICLAGWPET